MITRAGSNAIQTSKEKKNAFFNWCGGRFPGADEWLGLGRCNDHGLRSRADGHEFVFGHNLPTDVNFGDHEDLISASTSVPIGSTSFQLIHEQQPALPSRLRWMTGKTTTNKLHS